MKQKNFSVIIVFLLLSSMVFSMIISVKAEDTYDYDNTFFNYDVAEGDTFEYNLNYFFNFTASSTFYDEMDNWLIAEDITQDNFSSETYVNDLETFLEWDYKLELEITEMYSNEYKETNSSGDWYEQNSDIINASIQADLNEGEGWETPDAVTIDKLEDSKDFMKIYLSDTEYELFEASINATINSTQNPVNPTNWENYEVFRLNSSRRDYYSNGTLKECVPRELNNGTTEPENPFPEFGGPQSLPLFFPTKMNFEEFYDLNTDMFKFDLLWKIENNIPISPYNSTDTFQSVLTDQGISQIYVDQKSIGIVWNLDNFTTGIFSYILLADHYSNEESVIDDQVGTVAFAMEYDNDWALETFVIYAHIGLNLNTTGLEDAPNLVDEDVSFDITYTIAREGVTPPTEGEVLNGLIGENSPFEIPGFPIWFVGLFGLISIAALVVKHRK